MALTKEIYIRAKQHFKKFATEKPTLWAAGKSEGINTDQNLFAIACARYLTNDKTAYTDPEDQKEDFQKFAQSLRLNDFKSSNKQIDVGVGIGTSNNLLYKLAVDFLTQSGKDISNIKAKLSVINKAFEYPAFEDEYLRSNVLDDDNTFECITKQAFYKWHYSTYISNTALEQTIRQENAVDFSINGWDHLIVDNLTSKDKYGEINPSFFVSTSGAPFNTGFPVFCAVFEVGGISNLSDFRSSDRMEKIELSIAASVGSLFNRKNAAMAQINKYVHNSNKPIKFAEDVRLSKGGKSLVRFCIAYDYSLLILLEREDPTTYSNIGAVKQVLQELNPQILNFNPVANKATDIIIEEQINKLSSVISSKQATIETAPPLFTDKASNTLDVIKDFYSSEGLDPNAIDVVMSQKYEFDPISISTSISNEYNFLLNEYRKNREINPFFDDYDKSAITEDITFYYDNSYQLLAIFSNKKENYYNSTTIVQTPIQKNNIPFEYELKPGSLLQNLDPLYGIVPSVDTEAKDDLSNNSGIDGQIAFITEYFKNKLIEKQAYNQTLEPYVIYNDHYNNTLIKTSQYPLVYTATTVNGFFYNSNEIILLESAGDNPSFNSLNLQKEGSDVEFLTGDKTYEDVSAESKSIDSFLLKYHYPKLEIKPSFVDQIEEDFENINKKIKKAKDITNKVSNIGKKLGSLSEEDIKEQISQKAEEYFYNKKEKLLFEAQKQISIVAAASSKDPFLNDLSSIIEKGDLDEIYDKILTKFDWSELMAKQLKGDLSDLNEVLGAVEDIGADVSKSAAKAVDGCIQDLGDNVLDTIETIKSYKKAYDDIQKFLEKDLKDLIGLKDKVDYLYVLDFQEAARKKIEEQVKKIALKAISSILSNVVSNLQELAQEKYSEATEYLENEIGSQLDDALDELGGQIDTLESIGSNLDISSIADDIIEVDAISMLEQSGIEPIQNIINGAAQIYPALSKGLGGVINKTEVMTDYLNELSKNLTVPELKNLLQGFVTKEVKKLNQIVVDELDISSIIIKNELKNETNLSTLFAFTNQFMDNDIVNKAALKTVSRRTNPCFVSLGTKDTEKSILFEDFADEQTVLDKVNSITDSINKACDSINSVFDSVKNSTTDLLNDQDKKELLQSTEDLVNGTNTQTFLLLETILEEPENIFLYQNNKYKYIIGIEEGKEILKVVKGDKFGKFIANKILQAQIKLDKEKSFLDNFVDAFTDGGKVKFSSEKVQQLINEFIVSLNTKILSDTGIKGYVILNQPNSFEGVFSPYGGNGWLNIKEIAGSGGEVPNLTFWEPTQGGGEPLFSVRDTLQLKNTGNKVTVSYVTKSPDPVPYEFQDEQVLYSFDSGISTQTSWSDLVKAFIKVKNRGLAKGITGTAAEVRFSLGSLFTDNRESQGPFQGFNLNDDLLGKEVAARLDLTLDESTADTDYYTQNSFKMQEFIKRLKESK